MALPTPYDDNKNTYLGGAAVTTSDTVDLTYTSRALYIGGAGAVKVTLYDGSVVTFAAVPVGTVLRISATRVWATGTAATNILNLF